MNRRSSTALAVFGLLLAGLVVGAVTLSVGAMPCAAVGMQPRCQVALLPGPAEDTLGLVTLEGATTYPASGELLLTTIAVRDDLDLGSWWEARRTPGVATVARETVFPPGADTSEVAEQNALLMSDSQATAALAALEQLGFDVDAAARGARIAEVQDDVVSDELSDGDVVVAIDGAPIREAVELVEAIAGRSPGDEVRLDVVPSDGAAREVTVTLGSSPDGTDRAYVGVLLTTELDLPVEVDIDAGVIGGPSAGLMFALAVVELLEAEDLTGGTVVAGTGTITVDGRVGPVGGVRQKVVGVTERAGGAAPATVFLVPRANLPDAHRAPVASDLTVVPVDDLDGAVQALAQLRAGERPDGAVLLTAD